MASYALQTPLRVGARKAAWANNRFMFKYQTNRRILVDQALCVQPARRLEKAKLFGTQLYFNLNRRSMQKKGSPQVFNLVKLSRI